jgi:hypothetical protein
MVCVSFFSHSQMLLEHKTWNKDLHKPHLKIKTIAGNIRLGTGFGIKKSPFA